MSYHHCANTELDVLWIGKVDLTYKNVFGQKSVFQFSSTFGFKTFFIVAIETEINIKQILG